MKKFTAFLLALVILLTLCACGDTQSEASSEPEKTANYGLYIKDSEFFFSDLKSEARQLSTRLIDDDDIKDEDLAFLGNGLSLYTYVSGDGSMIFFPDKYSSSDDGFNLYYRKTKDTEAEPTKVDSDVTIYTVNSDATLVTYVKGTGEDRNLYQYAIKDDNKEKIASEVADYYVSKDGTKILYTNAEGNLYTKSGNEDKEKIASDITRIVYHSEDFTTVYYIKDEALYKQVIGGDKEKIDSDIRKVLQTYESGELYYLKREGEETTLMDYVVDDMVDVDAAAPDTYPKKPYSYYYDTDEEFEEAYALYEEQYEAYYAKQARDEWRYALTDSGLNHSVYTLCYFNGTESITITDTFAGNYEYTASAKTPVISYQIYNQEDFAKKKLSELAETGDISEFRESVLNAMFSSTDRYLALGETASIVKQENAAAIRINESGNEIYYVDDIPEEKNTGDLYRITITENVISEPELYDSDVCTVGAGFLSDTKFGYFKDYKDGNGDLYVNKAKIDYDVTPSYVHYNEKTDKICYLVDWDQEKSYGTLKEFTAESAVKISDDVHNFSVLPDGRILYLYDYSLKYYAGELHLWENAADRMIDDDVIYLVPLFDDVDELQKQVYTLNNTLNNTLNIPAAGAATEAPAVYW